MVGLLHASNTLQQHLLPPIAHLATVNPYIARMLEMDGSSGGSWAMPRQTMGLPSSAPAARIVGVEQRALECIGTSAFAFQVGTRHPVPGWQL
jgi:hypothetical protein